MASGSFVRRPAVLLALALCSVGAVVTLLARLAGGPAAEEKRTPLPGAGGVEAYPSFSPNGRKVAFSARGVAPGAPFHLYTRVLPGGAPQQLTNSAASDIGPAWSPDGAAIAFLRVGGETPGGPGVCMMIASSGGAERKIADCAVATDAAQTLPAVSWTPGGKSLVVVQSAGKQPSTIALVPLGDSSNPGAPRRITNPPAGSEGDSTPAVSPLGDTIAFARATDQGADVYLCDLAGAGLRRLTFDDRSIRGIAWTADGHDVVYAANRAGGWYLLRLPAYGGSPRALPISGRHAQFPAIAHTGRRLAYTDSPSVSAIWRAKLGAPESSIDELPLIRSAGREFAPAWSPDGRKIADISDQGGEEDIWVSDAEGGNRVRVTNMGGYRLWPPQWSPDGKTLLFEARGVGVPEVFTVPTDSKGPARATRLLAGREPSWSHDGASIYFQDRGRICKAATNGKNPRQLTAEGGGLPRESEDGQSVYFRNRRTIWRIPADGGEPEEAIAPESRVGYFELEPVKNGIYYMGFSLQDRALVVSFFEFKTKKSQALFHMNDLDFGPRACFSVSPDGKFILYARAGQVTNLTLVENFR